MTVRLQVAQDAHSPHLLGVGTVLGDDDLVIDGIQHSLRSSLLFGIFVVFPQFRHTLQEESGAVVDVAVDEARAVTQAAAGGISPFLYLLEAFFEAEKYIGLTLKSCIHLFFVDSLFVDKAFIVADNAVDDEVTQTLLLVDVEVQGFHVHGEHLYGVPHIGNVIPRPILARNGHGDIVARAVERILATLRAFLTVAVVVDKPLAIGTTQVAVVALRPVGRVGIVALFLVAAIDRIAAVEVEVLLAGGKEGVPVQVFQLTRERTFFHVRLGEVDGIVPEPMRRAITEVVGVVGERSRKHPVSSHARLQDRLVINTIPLVVDDNNVVPTLAALVLASKALEDDKAHLSVALGLEVDNVLNPYPVEVRLRLLAPLLARQVADKYRVDFGLKVFPCFLFPHFGFIEVLEAVGFPVGSIAAVVEEVVEGRVLSVEDAREFLEHQLAHRRGHDRIAEQGAEHIELLLRQEVLDKSHKVRLGGRVSHLHRLIDMKLQPVLVLDCLRNRPRFRSPSQPFP